jgi:hypothetical protein
MFRVIGFVSLLALCAGAAHAEDDRAAYDRRQELLTEQLNARIAKGVTVTPPPPAKAAPVAEEAIIAKTEGARR